MCCVLAGFLREGGAPQEQGCDPSAQSERDRIGEHPPPRFPSTRSSAPPLPSTPPSPLLPPPLPPPLSALSTLPAPLPLPPSSSAHAPPIPSSIPGGESCGRGGGARTLHSLVSKVSHARPLRCGSKDDTRNAEEPHLTGQPLPGTCSKLSLSHLSSTLPQPFPPLPPSCLPSPSPCPSANWSRSRSAPLPSSHRLPLALPSSAPPLHPLRPPTSRACSTRTAVALSSSSTSCRVARSPSSRPPPCSPACNCPSRRAS